MNKGKEIAILIISYIVLLIFYISNSDLIIERDEFGLKTLYGMIVFVFPIYLIIIAISFIKKFNLLIKLFLITSVFLLFQPYLIEIILRIDLPSIYYDIFYPKLLIVLLFIINTALIIKKMVTSDN